MRSQFCQWIMILGVAHLDGECTIMSVGCVYTPLMLEQQSNLRKNTNTLFDLRALGQQGFNFLADGRIVAQYNKNGHSCLVVADVNKHGPATNIQEFGMDNGLPMMFGGIIPGANNDLYFVGGSPSTPPSVYKWNLETKGSAEILACSSNQSFDDDIISVPKQIEVSLNCRLLHTYCTFKTIH